MSGRVAFKKSALLLEDQIALLESRGLVVPDKAEARRFLENISYYRMSGYTRYFADPDDEKRQKFRVGTTFQNVIDLYVFDRKMRVLMTEAFERIEVAVKGGLAYHGSINAGPFWMCEAGNFDHGHHDKVAVIINRACAPDGDKHKSVFLEAFHKKYSDPVPPAWMITELLSFGAVSIIYKHTKGAIRLPLAARCGVQHDVLESWLHALVFARNVCAHHMRFWNRRFTISPKIPRAYQGVWPENARVSLYLICCIVQHLLQRVGGDQTWATRLRDLVAARPNVPLASMGFPEDWDAKGFWAFT